MMGFDPLNTQRLGSICTGLVLAGGLLASPAALANTGPHQYEFERTGLTNEAISGAGSTIDSIYAFFDEADNTFIWEASYLSGDADPSKGYATAASTLPTGFVLVVNDGPMPKGQLGSLATLYFEAEEFYETDSGDPTLSAYAYNGADSASAHRTSDGRDVQSSNPAPPDQIASTRNFDFSSSSLSTNDDDTGPRIKRTVRIEIDATVIKNHTPAQPSIDFMTGDPLPGGWYGLGFAQEIGIWFHPFNKIDPEYFDSGPEEGFLMHGTVPGGDVNKGWQVVRNNYGFFDEDMLDARLVPEPAAALLLIAGLSLTTVRRRPA